MWCHEVGRIVPSVIHNHSRFLLWAHGLCYWRLVSADSRESTFDLRAVASLLAEPDLARGLEVALILLSLCLILRAWVELLKRP